MRRVVTILLTAVLGSNLFMAAAVARDRDKIGLGRHTSYYGSAVHHGKFWRGAAYHAYEPHCHMVRTQNIPLGHSVSLSSSRRAGPNERLTLTAKQGSSKLSRSSVASGPRRLDQRAGVYARFPEGSHLPWSPVCPRTGARGTLVRVCPRPDIS